MGDGIIFERTHHVDQDVHGAKWRKGDFLTAPSGKSRDIHEFHYRIGGFFWLKGRRKIVEPRVRDLDRRYVWLLTPGGAPGGRSAMGEYVENCGLAGTLQSDDSCLHSAKR